MILVQAAAFWSLVACWVVRIPALKRGRDFPATWAATVVGSIALLTLGVVIPQQQLDGIIGGHNWIKLIQICLATIAFWLTAQASVKTVGGPTFAVSPFVLVAMLVAIVWTFSCGDLTARTSTDFLNQHIDQIALWLSSTIYMGSVAAIALVLLGGLIRVRGYRASTMRVGVVMTIAASSIEIFALTAAHFGMPRDVDQYGYTAFNLLFYIGLILIAFGIASFSIGRSLRAREMAKLIPVLDVTLSRLDGYVVEVAGVGIAALWDRVVTLRDVQLMGHIVLSDLEETHLRRAEHLIGRQFADPLVAFQIRSTTFEPSGGFQ